jgi:hypothetical protein
LLESIQGQSQPHNGRGILSILPPLKMSGQKIDSHVESLRPIFGGMLLGVAPTTIPPKNAFLKKKAAVLVLFRGQQIMRL